MAKGQKRRVLIKLGTKVLTKEDGGIAGDRLKIILETLKPLHSKGEEFLIVTSGAVGLGRKTLGLKNKLSLTQKQACAAVGQSLLMNTYQELATPLGIQVAQILVTASDLSHRQRYLNLRETLETLLKMKVIPVINENDSISPAELKEDAKGKSFGDNDKLSAIVATKVDADLLVMLTDVDGVYDENPKKNSAAKIISVVKDISKLNISMVGKSETGRGGMVSKIDAAAIAVAGGVTTVIANGCKPHLLSEILDDKASSRPGTTIPLKKKLSKKRQWIGLASGFEGVVTVNEGAKNALLKKFASLLPSGVVKVQGAFDAGQVVSIQDESGKEIGRGVCNYSSKETARIKGLKTQEVFRILPDSGQDVVVHRDNLLILEEEHHEVT